MEEPRPLGHSRTASFIATRGAGPAQFRCLQAIWEHMHGHEMVYPKGRYDAPIYADAMNSMGSASRRAGRFEKLLVFGPSVAPRQACCGLRLARGTKSRARRLSGASGAGSVTENHSGNTRLCFWIR